MNMKWMSALLLLLTASVGIQLAQACSCVTPFLPQAAFEASYAVFLGEVIKTRRDGQDINQGNLFATFRVRQIWKGDLEAEEVVMTGPNSAACGVGFQKGKRYLVYASQRDGHLYTHLCSRTMRADGAYTDIDALGPPIRLLEEPSRGGCGGLTNIAALQGMFFIFLWIGFRRRRPG